MCNRTVQFLLDRDRREVLRYAPLQGSTAREVWDRHPGKDPGLKTMVYIRGFGSGEERLYFRSRAILEMLRDVGGKWRVAALGYLIPTPLRDVAYDWIARNRYAWFGRYEQCRLPEPGTEERFLP